MAIAFPDELIAQLNESRRNYSVAPHLRVLARSFAQTVLGSLFPHFSESVSCGHDAVYEDLTKVAETLAHLQRILSGSGQTVSPDCVPQFMAMLGTLHASMTEDAEAICAGDPAAQSTDEVILTYPGFLAIASYRLAHALSDLNVPLLPRLITEFAHEKTGIDIHPGAKIGRRFCVDHGTGIVVGQTAVIGDNVKIYQGVTLGALTVQKKMAHKKRHPTLEDNVVIYAGATILGGETVVGHDTIVAGNSWLTQSVPPYSLVNRQAEVRARSAGGVGDLEFMI